MNKKATLFFVCILSGMNKFYAVPDVARHHFVDRSYAEAIAASLRTARAEELARSSRVDTNLEEAIRQSKEQYKLEQSKTVKNLMSSTEAMRQQGDPKKRVDMYFELYELAGKQVSDKKTYADLVKKIDQAYEDRPSMRSVSDPFEAHLNRLITAATQSLDGLPEWAKVQLGRRNTRTIEKSITYKRLKSKGRRACEEVNYREFVDSVNSSIDMIHEKVDALKRYILESDGIISLANNMIRGMEGHNSQRRAEICLNVRKFVQNHVLDERISAELIARIDREYNQANQRDYARNPQPAIDQVFADMSNVIKMFESKEFYLNLLQTGIQEMYNARPEQKDVVYNRLVEMVADLPSMIRQTILTQASMYKGVTAGEYRDDDSRVRMLLSNAGANALYKRTIGRVLDLEYGRMKNKIRTDILDRGMAESLLNGFDLEIRRINRNNR